MTTTAIKERPILFSGPMVRAIQENRKTQTRRVIKPQPEHDGHWWKWKRYAAIDEAAFRRGLPILGSCPYGVPGDRLWVRETWGLHDTQPNDGPENATLYYRATDSERYDLRYQLWRHSIHMPRWASRITLEITNVRAERLQDISEEDAQAEGVDWPNPDSPQCGRTHPTCIDAFRVLWESINGPGSWDANPWVWVVEFKKVEQENQQ